MHTRFAGKLHLRTVLIVPFVVQIVGTVGLVGYLSFKSGQESVEDLAQQLMEQVGERVSDRLTTYLETPQKAVAANHLAVEQGLLNINDFEQLRQHLWLQLTLNPSLETLYFGNKPGEEIGYGRLQGEKRVKQASKLIGEDLSNGTPFIIQKNTDPGKRKYHLVDSKGNPTQLFYSFPIDNRTTLWYKTAKASKQQTWSPISVFKATPKLGIFAIAPIYNKAGQWQGTFVSSFTLATISSFLEQLQFSPSGQVFIMERSGNLVATSEPELPFVKPAQGEPKRLLAVNSKDTLTRDIARQLNQKIGNFHTLQGTRQLNLVSNHKRQFVRVTPYKDKYGLDWLVVTVVPESDFMEKIHANTRTTILFCLTALFGSIGIGIITARWITKPILRLNIAAKDIALGQWDKPIEIERTDEVGELANSFKTMAAHLQQSFAELQSLNAVLAQRESQLRQFFDAMPVGVSIHEATGKVLYFNQTAKHLLDVESIPDATNEEFAQVYQLYRQNQLYPTEELPALRALKGETVFVDDIEIHRDGKIIPCEIRFTPIVDEQGNIIYAIGAFADITQRKQSEQLLANYHYTLEAEVTERTAELARANEQLKQEIAERKKTEAKLYEAQRIAHIGSWEFNVATAKTTWTEELYHIHGLDPNQPIPERASVFERIHPDDRETYQQQIEHKAKAKESFETDVRIIRNDGAIRHVEVRGEPILNNQGELACIFGTVLDISDQKRAEQSLRESAQREKAIATVMQRMRQTLDIDTIFSATTEELRQVIECDRVVIYQFKSDWSGQFVSESVADGWISLMQQQNNNPDADDQLLNDPRCTVKTTMSRGTCEPIVDSYLQETKGGAYNGGINYRVTQDIYQAGFTECYLELLEQFQIRAYIIVPIYCGNQLWGLLASYQNSESRAWSEAEISTVVQIGIQLGVALQQAQLLQQTQQQAVQLQHTAYAAESANRAKSQFLANMSHELRTPLNGVLGYAQILQSDKNCTPKQKKGVDIIYQCGTHLLTLINDILDLSKIEAGKIELYPEDFDLPSLLTSLSEIFQLKATQKYITFTYVPLNQLPRMIQSDQKRLRQVLMNLLSNAVKFTDRGSVTFKVEVIGNEKQEQLPSPNYQLPITKIRFQIEDTGIGIPGEHLEKIFLPFEQVGDISRRAEGTGLGLTITQKIIELMRGQLFVESTPGVGSKFWFDLDVSAVSNLIESTTVKSTHNIIGYELIKAEGGGQWFDKSSASSLDPLTNRAEAGVREEGKKWKILIVDDRWENRTVLINMLEPLGFELEQAADGQEGLEKALEFKPDLILTDLVMPVMDGYQMTRQLRQLRELQNTIIIAISANAFEVDRLQSKDAGCNDFIPKPIQSGDLLEKIKRYLNLSWIYDNPSETKSQLKEGESSRYSQQLTTEMVIPPSEELLALYEAAETGFVSGVKTQALRLQQLNPDYSPFVTRILELAADFEYEEIAKLVDHYLSDNPE